MGVGLLLMRGLNAGSDWTHLVPGLIVAGVGVGMLNPPLASTAVGVVPPRQAGMASGINSTFRQVGIATGIALLGSLFAHRLHAAISDEISGNPHLAKLAPRLGAALTNGQFGHALHGAPPRQRAQLATVARSAFTTGLDHILLVAAVIAFASGVLSLLLIRTRDFVASDRPEG